MMDPVSPGDRSQTGVPDLIDDYRKRQEVWNDQARELARLRAQVLEAADREAANLVTGTRGQIAHLLANARRELLGLAAQIQAIPDVPGDSTATASAAVRNQILDARKELHDALADVQPEIERLTADARELSPSLRPQRHHAVVPRERVQESTEQGVAALVEKVPFADFDTSKPLEVARETPFWRRAWFAAAILMLVAAIAAALWWQRDRLTSILSRLKPSPAITAVSKVPPPARSEAPSTSSKQEPAPEAPHRFPVTLVIEADRPAWIRTTIDGRSDTGRVFAAGEKQTINADRDVVLRVGDAGSVFVTLNGAAREALGPRGVVATRRFAADAPPASGDSSAPAAPPPAKSSSTGATSQTFPALPADAGATRVPVVPTPAAAAPPVEPIRNAQPPDPDAGPTLTNAGERWLDAYYRQDAASLASMAAPDLKISDERRSEERLPPALPDVRRTLDGVTFQFVGDTALLTAKMIENSAVATGPIERVAWISQMWIREQSQWRLMAVHILSDNKLRPPTPKR